MSTATTARCPSNESGASRFHKVCVIIPALDEQEALPRVLHDLPDVGQVIVVDNGSRDRTAEIARQRGALVESEPRRGYGQACLSGLAAVERRRASEGFEPEVIVFVDADYSDHPEYLPALVDPILRGQADFVLGSRILGARDPGALSPQSLFGNRLACWLMWRLFAARYTDLGPFRAIRYQALQQLQMTDTNYGWTVEMQIKAARAGLKTREVPVPYRRRVGHSKISGTVSGTLKAGAKILLVIWRHSWRKPAMQ